MHKKGEMGELGTDPFTTIRIKRNMTHLRWDWPYATEERVFDWSSDNDHIASLCADQSKMLDTVGFAQTLNAEKKGKTEAAVYVIGIEAQPYLCKVGVSTNPTARLAQLQSAHYAPLNIHALLWSPTRKAETVEQAALMQAETDKVRLMGEWVAMTPDEALAAVIAQAKRLRVPLCDSATWVANWKTRMEALHKARLFAHTKPGHKPSRRPLYAA